MRDAEDAGTEGGPPRSRTRTEPPDELPAALREYALSEGAQPVRYTLRLGYAQVMVYLCDVNDTTHSFAISPESADGETLNIEGQLARGGMRELHGCAGTALLFDASRLHTVVVRPTPPLPLTRITL